jgi:LPXTG-motif cell wall-anchored protein
MRKTVLGFTTAMLVVMGAPAWACGGLIAPNGAVGLVKTSTLAAYVNGVEHYVTQFEFAGAEGEFGSIVPLPDIPSKVRKGGDWTLDRLAIEVQPPLLAFAAEGGAVADSAAKVEVIEQKQIGALQVTILKGGGFDVGQWAEDNGFSLPADAPAVLDFYANRSPIFMAAKFDATEAARRGLQIGQGTSIHLSIPTDEPWVPLRILSLGQSGAAVVKADVFLLTENRPALLPGPDGSDTQLSADGLSLVRDEVASEFLLTDLSSDRGMHWLPTQGMWFSYMKLREEASDLTYDLAMDVNGGRPSVVDAGLSGLRLPETGSAWPTVAILGGLGLIVAAFGIRRRVLAG